MAEHKLTNNLEVMEGAEDTFKKISNYLLGELNLSTQDYKLLEEMNMVTAQKYSGMADNGAQLVQFMKDLRDKYQSFAPFLEKIDQIEKSVQSLDLVVAQLDEYSKRLEAKFKSLDM